MVARPAGKKQLRVQVLVTEYDPLGRFDFTPQRGPLKLAETGKYYWVCFDFTPQRGPLKY